jgi:ABC-type proline/glycine betaine transport system permease subunit
MGIGNWFYTDKIDSKVEKHREGFQNTVNNGLNKFGETAEKTVKAIGETAEKTVNTLDERVEKTVETISNLAQSIIVLIIMVGVSLFNYHQNGFYSLEILVFELLFF